MNVESSHACFPTQHKLLFVKSRVTSLHACSPRQHWCVPSSETFSLSVGQSMAHVLLCSVHTSVGGDVLGPADGEVLGPEDGCALGTSEGDMEGPVEGKELGCADGETLGP